MQIFEHFLTYIFGNIQQCLAFLVHKTYISKFLGTLFVTKQSYFSPIFPNRNFTSRSLCSNISVTVLHFWTLKVFELFFNSHFNFQRSQKCWKLCFNLNFLFHSLRYFFKAICTWKRTNFSFLCFLKKKYNLFWLMKTFSLFQSTFLPHFYSVQPYWEDFE